MSEINSAVWRFGDVLFDASRMRLVVRGQTAELPRKSLQVLHLLLQHAGELVTKDEMVDSCWDGKPITDSALTSTVARLRQVLNADRPGLIETVKGYGYRLAAPVSVDVEVPLTIPHLDLQAGDHPPGRPEWRLQESLAVGGQADVWLASANEQHKAIEQRRVFKFAGDHRGNQALKREIAINRLLRECCDEDAGFLWLDDWALDEQPAFLASPYIDGGNLSDWADAQGGLSQVPLEIRLDLAAQCAEALALAHAAGVLHKDLKPGNILVDTQGESPRVRLADFASGTVLDREQLRQYLLTQRDTTATMDYIDEGSGSLLYMAPELLRGDAASEQADIYAWGILLYQLLVGNLREPLTAGWEARIDDELLRQDIAECAHGDVAERARDIATMAQRLRSLPQRRRTQQRQQQEQARLEQMQEQLRRSRQRRPWVLGLLASLLIGLVLTTVLAWQLRKALSNAERQVAIAEAVSEFVQEDLLALANPHQAGMADPRMKDVLKLAQQRVGERFKGQPLLEGVVRRAIGTTWHGMANDEDAEAQLRQAVALLEPLGDQAGLELAKAYLHLGENLSIRVLPGARDMLTAAYEQSKEGTSLPFLRVAWRAELELARMDTWDGRFEKGISRMRGIFTQVQKRLPATDELHSLTALWLAWALQDIGKAEEARAILEPVFAASVEKYGEISTKTTQLSFVLGQVYRSLKLYELGQQQFQLAIDGAAAVLGKEHLEYLGARMYMAELWADMGQIQRALDELRALREPVIQHQGEIIWIVELDTLLVNLLIDHERWQEALVDGHTAIQELMRFDPDDLEALGALRAALGYAEAQLGRFEKAAEHFEKAMALLPGSMEATAPEWLRAKQQYEEFERLSKAQ